MDLSVSETNKHVLEKEEYLESLRALDFMEEMRDDTDSVTNAWIISKHQFKLTGSKYLLEYTPNSGSVRWRKSALCLLDWEDLVEENLLHVVSGAKHVSFEDVMEGCSEEVQEKLIFHLDLLEEREGLPNHNIHFNSGTYIGHGGNISIASATGNYTVNSFTGASTANPISTLGASNTTATASINPCREITLTTTLTDTASDTTGFSAGDLASSTDSSTFIKLN